MNVRPTAKPVVLVLTAYNAVDWHVSLSNGARVKRVIMSGYFEQEIRGLPAGIPVENRSYFPVDGSRRKEGWFYAHEWNTLGWREMVRQTERADGPQRHLLPGRKPGRFLHRRWKHSAANFGQDGLSFASAREPAPQDLRAASANASLHVLGIYDSGNEKRGGLVDVLVRPAPSRSCWC